MLVDLLDSRINGERAAPIFLNVRGQPMTRSGVYELVVRSAKKAVQVMPSMQQKSVTPHTIRHTTSVHLLRAKVDINTIRA